MAAAGQIAQGLWWRGGAELRIARDAMADAANPAAFLDVQVHQVPGALPLVAPHGNGRLEGAQPAQPLALEQAGDRGPADAQGVGNLGPGPALAAQALDLAHELGRGGGGTGVRAAGPVPQPGRAFGLIALAPLPHGAFADAERLGHVTGRLGALLQALDQTGSTVGVVRAFWWMFIRASGLGWLAASQPPASQTRLG
jgi:hypothetical protein